MNTVRQTQIAAARAAAETAYAPADCSHGAHMNALRAAEWAAQEAASKVAGAGVSDIAHGAAICAAYRYNSSS